jgi:hypothetical protein
MFLNSLSEVFNNTRCSLNAPEVWMLNYTGLMDEFRVYNIALTENEVVALYKLEKIIDKIRKS